MMIGYKESASIIDVFITILETLKKRIDQSSDKEDLLNSIRILREILQQSYFITEHIPHGGSATGFRGFTPMMIHNAGLILLNSADYSVEEIKEKLNEGKGKAPDIFDILWRSLKPNFPPVRMTKKHHPRENSPQYFYSYAHADYNSEAIIDLLKGFIPYQVKFWVDKDDLSRHNELPLALSQAVDKSKAAILMISENYLKSKWCNKEWVAALQQNISRDPPLRLYLCVLDECEIPSFLAPFFRTNFTIFPSQESFLELIRLSQDILEYERMNASV